MMGTLCGQNLKWHQPLGLVKRQRPRAQEQTWEFTICLKMSFQDRRKGNMIQCWDSWFPLGKKSCNPTSKESQK